MSIFLRSSYDSARSYCCLLILMSFVFDTWTVVVIYHAVCAIIIINVCLCVAVTDPSVIHMEFHEM